jgi:hypothetical protein
VLAGHRDPQPDRDRGVQVDAVVVEHPFGGVDPVRDLRDDRPFQQFGLAEDLVPGQFERLEAEPPDDLLQPPLAHLDARHHRVHVAGGRVREADVRADRVDDRALLHASGDQLLRSQAQALLEDRDRVHRPAGVLGADVDPVRPARGEADQGLVDEDRAEDGDVVEVRAAEVAVVEDPDVARLPHLAAEPLLGGERAGLQVAQEDRQARRLAEHLVVGVEQGDDTVPALVDDRGVGRPDERGVHVVGGRVQRVPDDLDGHRVDGGGGGHRLSFRRMTREPMSSTLTA